MDSITQTAPKEHKPSEHVLEDKRFQIELSDSRIADIVREAAQEMRDQNLAVAFASGLMVAAEAMLNKSVQGRDDGRPSATVKFPGLAEVTIHIKNLRE